MQIQSLGLLVKLDFEFDPTQTTLNTAIREALDLAFRPSNQTSKSGVTLSEIRIDDLEGAGTLKEITVKH